MTTDNGQQLPLDWEGLVNEGIEARKMGDQSNWRLGDLALQVETTRGRHGKGLQEYADSIKANYSTLVEYRTVAKKFPERSGTISWSHYQVVAARDDAEAILAEHGDLSIAGLRQWLREHPEVADEGLYRTLVIDPPWPMEKIEREVRPNQGQHLDYPTMTVEDLMKWQPRDYAVTEGCHIYLWTTHRFLPDAFRVFNEWGVKYECLLTWVKNVGITPFSWMYSTEHVLFGRIGSLPLMEMGKRIDFQAAVRGHSRKPDEFYDLVRVVSPEPRLDVFSREAREGFDQLGDEADRFSDVIAAN